MTGLSTPDESGHNDDVSGRHQGQRRRYAGRHRAPVRHTGAISLAALAIVGAAGGLSASIALSQGSNPVKQPSGASSSMPADRATSAPPTPSITPSSPPAAQPPAVARNPAGHPAPAGPLLVLRTLNGPSWIAVTHHGRQLIGRTVGPHQRLVFHGRTWHITVGNAGAVSVRVNGGHPHRAGQPGEVRSFTA